MFKKRTKNKKEKLEKKFLKWEFLLLFVLILSLTAFFHFKETRFILFELNRAAPKDIVVVEDFSYMNKKQMLLLKQEAMVDIGKIWKIKESDLQNIEKNILRYLSNHPSWRNSFTATYREMSHLLENIKKTMRNWYFTDRRTYRKREEIGISVNHYSILENQIGKKAYSLPNNFWGKLQVEIIHRNKAFDKEVKYLIGKYANEKYLLIRDYAEKIKMETSLFQTIPEVFSHKYKNDILVKKGERIGSEEYNQILAMKEAIQKSRNLYSPTKILSSILLAILVVGIGWLFFYMRNKKTLQNINTLSLYIVLIISMCGIAKSCEWIINSVPHSISTYIQFPVIIPFMSILLSLFISESIALFTTMYLTVLIGLTLSLDQSHFIIINTFSGIVATLFASRMKKRKEIFYGMFLKFGVYVQSLLSYIYSI